MPATKRRSYGSSQSFDSWNVVFHVQAETHENKTSKLFSTDTVDGQNPAPPIMMIIPLFIGFEPSQVVQDFVHQQYDTDMYFYM